MSDLDFRSLKHRGLSILRVTASGWQELQETRGRGARFTSVFPHHIARSGKARSPVLIVVEGGQVSTPLCKDVEPQLKFAWINSIQAIATRDSRVSFDHVSPAMPDTLAVLVGPDVPSQFKASAKCLLNSTAEFAGISPRFGGWLLDRLSEYSGNHRVLRRMAALVDRPSQFRDGVALQQDALELALKAFGAPAAKASALALSPRTTTLATARTQENLVISHDARWIPGWTLDDSDVTGWAVFRQDDDRLEVFTANHEDLERLFGVDLIYLNQTRRSIVMVQYKMMEPLPRREREVNTGFGTVTKFDEVEWVVPINPQFRDEMTRMVRFDRPASGGAESYRLSANPFFFKLVRRNGSTGGAGILLSLRHLQHLIARGA
jgi:hypothetical protein